MTCSNNATLNVKAGLNKVSILFLAVLCFINTAAFSQNQGEGDSLVRLVEAQSAHLLEIDSVAYRKIVGRATFLHNNTYLMCDTALWNVSTNIIKAMGNVEVLQGNTTLISDTIEYVVAENLAKVRGSLVQLFDKEGNVLNTNYLNYNTQDSIATFFNGAAMSNPDGNIMESVRGVYITKDKVFRFRDSVQMFTDSVCIVSDRVDYHTDTDIAVFFKNTTAWKDENILFANSGYFNRRANLIAFDKDSYILTKEQELWADTLMYWRNSGNAELYRNVQVLDTVQSALALAHKATYKPSPRVIELTEQPAVGMYSVENGVADTLFLSGDRIIYSTKRMFEVDSLDIVNAKSRLELSAIDPIALHDQERKKGVQSGKGNLNSSLMGAPGGKSLSGGKLEAAKGQPSEQAKKEADTVAVVDVAAVAPVKDTTEVAFIDIFHNVKFYRSDVQGVCDSLVYTGLDSMARFYSRPAMWHDVTSQFTADSIQAVLKNNTLDKINLLSNAFIAMQEDTVHYNQIKSTEMAAYFAEGELYRFDALGGVSSIFYIAEDSLITLMDQEECKMMTAKIKENRVQRTRSIGDLKQNVFPVFNLPIDKQRLRGFEWRGVECPRTRFDVTDRRILPGQRVKIESIPLPGFRYTLRYFSDLHTPVIEYISSSVREK